MLPLRLVIDTNVLVSAAIKPLGPFDFGRSEFLPRLAAGSRQRQAQIGGISV